MRLRRATAACEGWPPMEGGAHGAGPVLLRPRTKKALSGSVMGNYGRRGGVNKGLECVIAFAIVLVQSPSLRPPLHPNPLHPCVIYVSPMTPMRAALLTLLATPGLALRVAPPTPQLWPLARAQPPSMSLALPGCAASGIFAVAAKAGCATGIAQLGLQTFFAKSSDPVLAQAPGYSAHQLVALALMLYATTFGLLGWLSPPAYTATAAGRLLAVSASARFLGATLLGALLAWDIPTCLAVPRLRKPDVLGHHVAMAATALVGCTALPTHYGLYYMGVVELSSIPLTIYDQARDGRSPTHTPPAAQTSSARCPVHRHTSRRRPSLPRRRRASPRRCRRSAQPHCARCCLKKGPSRTRETGPDTQLTLPTVLKPSHSHLLYTYY